MFYEYFETIGLAFLIALGFCVALMPPFIMIMEKYRILDKSGGRKIHKGYTAHMGGVIIAVSFALSMLGMVFLFNKDVEVPKVGFFAILALIMIVLGVRDDMNNVTPWGKLIIEIIVGFCMSYAGLKITDFTGLTAGQVIHIPEWLSYVITIFFFIVVCNAYNLIDGIDGQAGMQAVNVFLFILMFFLYHVANQNLFPGISSTFVTMFCAAILGGLVGFLFFNWQGAKAKIFMGDTGSLFIGTLITIAIILTIKYAYAITFVKQTPNHAPLKAIVVPTICLFYIPLADTLRVFIGRMRKGKSPFAADKTHIHHILLRMGYSHQKCTLTTFYLSFVISIITTYLGLHFTDIQLAVLVILSWFPYVWTLQGIATRIQHREIKKQQ